VRSRRAIAVSLLIVGLVLTAWGAIFFVAWMLAMDPEDEIPLAVWLIPTVVGIASVAAGSRLLPRAAGKAPTGGW
jgi:hypothetical protein